MCDEFIHSFTVVCLKTGPKPLPKRALHIVRSRASSFKWEYPLLSLRSSSSFLCLLPHLVTSVPPFIFPSITYCRRQWWIHYKITAGEHKDISKFQNCSISQPKEFHKETSCETFKNTVPPTNTEKIKTWHFLQCKFLLKFQIGIQK